MKPSLNQFEIFISVVETGGFTAAAKQLGLTKAAISKSIKALEKELGVDLLLRSTRSMQLTDEGRALLQQCQQLKEALDNTRAMASAFHGEPKGTLRISCSPSLIKELLLPVLKTYRRDFPEVKINVLAEERPVDFKKEKVDISFAVNWMPANDVVARKITTTRYVLCASPDYFSTNGMPDSLSDLQRHCLIGHSSRAVPKQLVNLKRKTNVEFQDYLFANNAESMKEFAEAGLGLVQLHEYVVREALNNGSLIEVLAGEFVGEIPLYVYYPKQYFVQPKIRRFIDCVFSS